jgi:hypothetical protein
LFRTPFFEFKSLDSGLGYDVVVVAYNKKGRSNPVVLQAFTVKHPEKQTGEIDFFIRW